MTQPTMLISGRKPLLRAFTGFLGRWATTLGTDWRWVFYIAFLAIRVGRYVLDQPFPANDGSAYYIKTAWMAAAPFPHAMPWKAFEFLPLRPPGVMWLCLPFLLVRLSFLSFAVGLFTWVVVAVELAVRSLFPANRRLARNAFAVALICGNVAFFSGAETFWVDHIHTAFTVAAAGLAVGWLREKRLRFAVACGLASAMTLWIKPAGLALIISVIGSLGVALLAEALLDGRPALRANLRRRLPHLAALLFFPTLAVLSLFLSSYSAAWEQFRPGRVRHWKKEYLQSWYAVDDGRMSLQGAVQVARNAAEVAGPGMLLVLLLGGLFMLVRRFPLRLPKSDEERIFLLSTLFLLLVTLGIFLFTWRLPVKVNRYTAPFVALVVATGCHLVFSPTHLGRAMLWTVLVLSVAWRALYVVEAIPYRPWLRGPRTFACPMREARRSILAVSEACNRIDPPREVSILGLNPSAEYAGLSLVWFARWAGVERAARELAFKNPLTLYCPSWPEFEFTELPRFLEVDFILTHTFHPLDTYPEGSRRADLMAMEKALHDPDTAREAGWEMFHETPNARFYISAANTGSMSSVEAMSRRVRFLENMDFRSEDGRALARSVLTSARLRGVGPASRKIVKSDLSKDVCGLLVHAPYKGNPLPEVLELELLPGDRLLFQMRDAEDADGVTVEMDTRSGSGWDLERSWHLAPGERREIDPWAKFQRKPNMRVRFRFLPGPAGNTSNDCLSVAVVR